MSDETEDLLHSDWICEACSNGDHENCCRLVECKCEECWQPEYFQKKIEELEARKK